MVLARRDPSMNRTKTGDEVMTTKPTTSRTKQQVADQKLSDGLKKHKTELVSFALAGASSTVDAVLAVLDTRIAAESAAEVARAAWQTKVKAARDERATTKALVAGVRESLKLRYAGAIDTLADFGLKPRKQPAVRTPEEKAQAAAKAKATRAARHTMGSKQKKSVKGTITTIVPATPSTAKEPVATSPAAPAPATPGTASTATPHTT
jgi:hypothetical protein